MKIVYFNLDAYIETDIVILPYLAKQYDVIWIPLRYSDFNQFTKEDIIRFAHKHNINVKYFEYNCRQRSFGFLITILKICRLICTIKPDVVYSSTRTLWWAVCSSIFIKKKNRISAFHDVKYHSSAPHKRINLFSDWLIRKSSTCASVFSKNQQRIFEQRFGYAPFLHELASKDFGESQCETGSVEKQLKILFFGSIQKYKGLDLLIQAMESLTENEKQRITLSVCGKGAFWNECKQFIKTPSLYNLNIRFIANSEVPDLMCSHHFLVLPYRDATQSGPVAIAVNYGTPIIAPDIDSFTDVYDVSNSIFYSQGNVVEGLRRALLLTDLEYTNMKKRCEVVKEKFSPSNIANKYVCLFNQVN